MQENAGDGAYLQLRGRRAGRCTVALGRRYQVTMTQLSMPAEQAPTVISNLTFKNASLLAS